MKRLKSAKDTIGDLNMKLRRHTGETLRNETVVIIYHGFVFCNTNSTMVTYGGRNEGYIELFWYIFNVDMY